MHENRCSCSFSRCKVQEYKFSGNTTRPQMTKALTSRYITRLEHWLMRTSASNLRIVVILFHHNAGRLPLNEVILSTAKNTN